MLALGLTVCLAAPGATDGRSADPVERLASPTVELYFELKLLYRGRRFFRRVEIDQWAGGRLLMRRESHEGADGVAETRLSLLRPLEDPWTFRWYPTRHEVKLGAAVWVPRPEGDAYGALATRLEPAARERYRRWWRDDLVRRTAPEVPSWASAAERFWADRHRDEASVKDPLHEHPVYPFHVLGDARDRFIVRLDPRGVPVPGGIVETMSEPWLPDGWRSWQAGGRPAGYGYWGRDRPAWEPRTYPAMAAALGLLGWSPWDEATPTSDLLAQASLVVATLLPRTAGQMSWSGSPVMTFTSRDDDGRVTSLRGESGPTRATSDPRIVYRAWRYLRVDHGDGRVEQDELQLLLTLDDGADVKLWLVIGYGPAGENER